MKPVSLYDCLDSPCMHVAVQSRQPTSCKLPDDSRGNDVSHQLQLVYILWHLEFKQTSIKAIHHVKLFTNPACAYHFMASLLSCHTPLYDMVDLRITWHMYICKSNGR